MPDDKENTPENLKKYIELSKDLYAKEKNRRNLRSATHIILDFYKMLLSEIGNRIGERTCETQPLPTKFFLIRMHIAEFEDKEKLILKIEEVRNRIYHNDLWFSATNLKYLIKEAEDFLSFSVRKVNDYYKRGEKIKSLADKVMDANYNVGFYIILNEDIGYSEVLDEFRQRKAGYDALDLGALQDKNLEAILELLSNEIHRLKSLYDRAWDSCPKCGGKIIHKTDSTVHYSGVEGDQEPCAVTYFEKVECEKCGYKLMDEQETSDI